MFEQEKRETGGPDFPTVLKTGRLVAVTRMNLGLYSAASGRSTETYVRALRFVVKDTRPSLRAKSV